MDQKQITKTVFSFFGPPGSGKGTLAQKLVQDNGFVMLSTGNLCREHVARGTSFGIMLDQYLKKGDLIPDELISEMVIDWLGLNGTTDAALILDGFPRTQSQAEIFCSFLSKQRHYVFQVVVIELPDHEIVTRLSKRLMCSNKKCQAIYKQDDGLQSCTLCNSPLFKRSDDEEDVIRNRLVQYHGYRDNLLSFYKKQGISIATMDIKGLSPLAVYEYFCNIFSESVS